MARGIIDGVHVDVNDAGAVRSGTLGGGGTPQPVKDGGGRSVHSSGNGLLPRHGQREYVRTGEGESICGAGIAVGWIGWGLRRDHPPQEVVGEIASVRRVAGRVAAGRDRVVLVGEA